MKEKKGLVSRIVKKLIGLTDQKTAIKLRYLIAFKTLPNLNNPVTFNEKINAYKFMGDKYDFHKYADKVAVKDYVAEKIGAEHVIPTLYAGKTLPPREERTWEMPYIIKLNHCSGWNIMVRNEKERDWNKIEKKIAKWSKKTFGKDTGEVHYSKIEPMVLVEKFISEDDNAVPRDYKVFVFNGKTEFIEVVSDRESSVSASFYDTNWNKLEFSFSDTNMYKGENIRPDLLESIISLAEILGADFPFVRTDFYVVKNNILFGEMTFTPSAGFARLKPRKYEKIYGDKLNIF